MNHDTFPNLLSCIQTDLVGREMAMTTIYKESLE